MGETLGSRDLEIRKHCEKLTSEERAILSRCQLYLDESGNGFGGTIDGHQVKLNYSSGGYRGFVDGDKALSPEQAESLYRHFFNIANAQSTDRIMQVRENNPETEAIVSKMLGA